MATRPVKTSDRVPDCENPCAFVAIREAQMALNSGTPGAVVSQPGDEPQKQALPLHQPPPRVSKYSVTRGQPGSSSFVESILAEPPQLYETISSAPLRITKVFNGYNKNGNKESLSPIPLTDDDSEKFDFDFDNESSTRCHTLSKVSHSVEKRNARERTRVHTVNQAFSILKNRLPNLRANTKRVSKLKILRTAIDYINTLRNMLHTSSDLFFRENLRIALDKPKSTPNLNEEIKHRQFSVTDEVCDRLQTNLYTANQNRMPFFTGNTNNLPTNISGANAQVALFGSGVSTTPSASTVAASALFNQSLASNATGSNLIRFPYVESYENLYQNPGAPFYVPTSQENMSCLTMGTDDLNLQYPASAADHAGQLALYY